MNMKKVTLVTLGFIATITIGLIAPVMADFAKDFPEVSSTGIAMMVTVPSFSMMFGLFASPVIMQRVSRKNILLTCIALVTGTAMLPTILSNFTMIFITRVFLGFFLGAMTPIGTTYFAEYPEQERAKLMGINSAIGNILATVTFFGIALLNMTWRQAFLIYGVFLAIWLLCFFFLPQDDMVAKKKALEEEKAKKATNQAPQEAESGKGSLKDPMMLLGFFTAFFLMVQFYIVPTKMAFYVTENGLGTGSVAGLITGLGNIVMAISSFCFPILRKTFKDALPSVLLLSSTIGFSILAFPSSLVSLAVGYAFLSLTCASLSVTLMMKMTETLPIAMVGLGSAIMTACLFVGQFVSPYYQVLVSDLTGLGTRGFLVYAVIFAVLAAVFYVAAKKHAR